MKKAQRTIAGIPLSNLLIGQKKYVSQFTDEQLGSKLMAMGMLPGSSIELVRTGMGGKTLYIKFNNGYCMAIRRSEAINILLE